MILLSLLPNHCFQNAESSNKINYKKHVIKLNVLSVKRGLVWVSI